MSDHIDTLVHDAVSRVPDRPGDLAAVTSRARRRTRSRALTGSALAVAAIAALSIVVLGSLRGPAAPVIGDGSAPGDDGTVVDPRCTEACPGPTARHRAIEAIIDQGRVEEAYASDDSLVALAYTLQMYLGLWEAGPDRPAGVQQLDVLGVTERPDDEEHPVTVHLDILPERADPYCAGVSPSFGQQGELLGYRWVAHPGTCEDTLPAAVLDELAGDGA